MVRNHAIRAAAGTRPRCKNGSLGKHAPCRNIPGMPEAREQPTHHVLRFNR